MELIEPYKDLHELGHLKGLELLRLPHSKIKVFKDKNYLIAQIKYKPRNVLDRLIIATCGHVYPWVFVLKHFKVLYQYDRGSLKFIIVFTLFCFPYVFRDLRGHQN